MMLQKQMYDVYPPNATNEYNDLIIAENVETITRFQYCEVAGSKNNAIVA